MSKDIEQLRQLRWEILFKLYEFYMEQPGQFIEAEAICTALGIECYSKDMKGALVYLEQKNLIEAGSVSDDSGLYVKQARISADGVDLVEDYIESEQANLNKKPIGFGRWNVAETSKSVFIEGEERKS